MTTRPVIDAGPALNFFSINQERLLLATLGPISAPETVEKEVLHKARTDRRFSATERVWRKLPRRLLKVLPDDTTPELARAVARITALPMAERVRQGKDLGELMVIAHAVVAAEAGRTVTVLIDDGQGARLAALQAERLARLRAGAHGVGHLRLASTYTVLERAAGGAHLPDRESMRHVYGRLRTCDDGLLPIERTRLLSSRFWS